MPNVFAKISGLDADRADDWTGVDMGPYIDRALELFGPERLMFVACGQPTRRLQQSVARDQSRARLPLTLRTRSYPGRHRRRVLSPVSYRSSVAVMYSQNSADLPIETKTTATFDL